MGVPPAFSTGIPEMGLSAAQPRRRRGAEVGEGIRGGRCMRSSGTSEARSGGKFWVSSLKAGTTSYPAL